jgi:hypothetical protein
VSQALGDRGRCVTAWAAFEAAAPRSLALVLIEERLAQAPWLDDLKALRTRLAHVPLVLATGADAEQVEEAGRVGFDAFVPFGQLVPGLSPAADRALRESPRHRLAYGISNAPALSSDLRECLLKALSHPVPPRTAAGAARLCGRRLNTLELHWRATQTPDGEVRLKDLIDGVQLFRACELAATGLPWHEIALEMRVSMRALRRKARRAWGLGLDDLRRIGRDGAVLLLLAELGIAAPPDP